MYNHRCGGANASIRFEPEINHGANAGLINALQLLQPIKDKHPEAGWADLIQLASATAIEAAGEPKQLNAAVVHFASSRVDHPSAEESLAHVCWLLLSSSNRNEPLDACWVVSSRKLRFNESGRK